MGDVFVPVSENISGFFVKKLRTVLWRFAIWIGSWFSGAGIVTVLRVVGAGLAAMRPARWDAVVAVRRGGLSIRFGAAAGPFRLYGHPFQGLR